VRSVERWAIFLDDRQTGNRHCLAPRNGFRLFWTWKIRHGRLGRPTVPRDVRELIRKMSRENPLWGAPRIHGELLKLGIHIGETSVGKYMVRGRKPPSQTWRTFLENHVKTMVSGDFFTVPTIRFQVLCRADRANPRRDRGEYRD
jgi:putative transposase